MYRKGLPTTFTDMVNIGHNSNQLCSIVNNEYARMAGNNIGVLSGTPLSAHLFIIYADRIMYAYIKMAKTTLPKILKVIYLSEMKVCNLDGPTPYYTIKKKIMKTS